MILFDDIYRESRVLITGHTGFKGSWLTTWLHKLGADIVGVSKDIPTQPSMFNELGLENKITHIFGDIRDIEFVSRIVCNTQPDYVFHLAAQAIVSKSYTDPLETITTNVIGTANVLESLRQLNKPCIAVLITSDKCYDNLEWTWGYRETDSLGGKDIYSGSKGAAELIIKSYFHSYLADGKYLKLGIGRAGNVIGGGDWAKDRIVVDCIVAWNNGKKVEIRSPNATRPWQHVLEPLSGYLALGQNIYNRHNLHGEAFNFGPRSEQNRRVIDLLSDLGGYWGYTDEDKPYRIINNVQFHEAGLLKLNCDKALQYLGWEPNLKYEETIHLVGEWYKNYYNKQQNMYEFTLEQIRKYESLGMSRNRIWAKDNNE